MVKEADDDASTGSGTPGSGAVRVKYHVVKSTQFRVIHADGVWGGATPHGNISISFFNERLPIPQLMELEYAPGKSAVEVLSARVAKQGVIREVETCVIMGINEAREFREWLDMRIKELEVLTEVPQPTNRKE